jgi:hypothetical protein
MHTAHRNIDQLTNSRGEEGGKQTVWASPAPALLVDACSCTLNAGYTEIAHAPGWGGVAHRKNLI